jgi:uncharacterized phage-associated protein
MEAAMQTSMTVANRFLEFARERGDALTPMQILKLVYIAHGWMLGLHGRPLIREEVEAWQYGPVIRQLYNEIRHFKSQPVTGQINKGEGVLDAEESDIISQVYAVYGNKSGPALSRLTHQAGSPWHRVYEPGSFGDVIPNDLIEDHYAQLAKRAAERAAAA